MRDVVIVDAVRTPIGKYNGALKDIRPDDLAATVIKALLSRNPELDPEQIEDVAFGCANQAGEDNRNVARMASLLAGLPTRVAATTINRLCGSGLDAINYAARTILANEAEIMIAGGVESMTRAPFVMGKPEQEFPRGNLEMFDTTLGWRFINPKLDAVYGSEAMAKTAENVAKRFQITRKEQDAFAYFSQQKAAEAIKSHRFDDEIIPVTYVDKKGEKVVVTKDEHPRPNVAIEKLATLSPMFKGGSVTAGNASGINDGASALLLMTSQKANELQIRPIARYVTSAVSGTEPSVMGLGPIEASKKALLRAKLSAGDLDLIELNEAFAAQAIPCMRELDLQMEKVNVNGGAIALGHPLGASGARIVTTLVHEMKKRGARYGLATMCIGVGQGIASIFEGI